MPFRISAFRCFAFAAALALVSTAPSLAGLKIIRNPTGGNGGTPPANIVGGGNLIDIFNQAADYWEMAFPDPDQNWTVEFEYRWDPIGNSDGTYFAQYTPFTAGGDPRRLQSGLVTFLNNGVALWFADPHPATNSAYSFVEPNGAFAIFPDPPPEDIYINAGITFKNPTNPDAIGRTDLLTAAIHEIGHGLGLAAAAPLWVTPNEIIISSAVSTRYAGAVISYQAGGNEHLNYPAIMTGQFFPDERRFPSVVDILAIAQISQFNRPLLSPYMEMIIRGLDLPPGQKTALQTKLQKSRALFAAGKHTAARNLLNAFINQINANPGNRFNHEQLDGLVSMAELRIDYIDSAPPSEHDGHSPPIPGPAACGTVSATMLPLTLIGLALVRMPKPGR